jgi:predicted PilT family ATPase
MSTSQRDLSRPVVEVRDFETGILEFEMFTFGGERIVVPVQGEKPPSYGRRGRQERGAPGETVPLSVSYSKKKVTVYAGRKYSKQRIDIFADGQYLFTTVIGRNGESSIRIKTRQGRTLVDAMEEGTTIKGQVSR